MRSMASDVAKKEKKEKEQVHHTQQGIQSCRTLVHFEERTGGIRR
jgi:hypothetical protein